MPSHPVRVSVRWLLVPSCFLVLILVPFAAEMPPAEGLGKKVTGLSWRDAGDRPCTLPDLQGKKATVLVFLSFECPVAAGYAATLAELARTYRERDVAFVGLHAPEEPAGEVEKRARDFRLPFPVFRDERLAAAELLHTEVTPEVFVLDGELRLRYRGRIDDRYAARLRPR
jgi:hypothetical protein